MIGVKSKLCFTAIGPYIHKSELRPRTAHEAHQSRDLRQKFQKLNDVIWGPPTRLENHFLISVCARKEEDNNYN
jgi:hypothetical protein